MAFLDKLNQVAKNLGDKTGDAIEITRLNAKISSELFAATENLAKIGEHYYSQFSESGEAAPEILEFCQNVKTHRDAAALAQAEIDRIKAESEPPKPAPSAGQRGLICPSCGTTNGAGTKFCQSCGTKLESPVTPQVRSCPGCGAPVSPGVRFCSECGSMVE